MLDRTLRFLASANRILATTLAESSDSLTFRGGERTPRHAVSLQSKATAATCADKYKARSLLNDVAQSSQSR